MDKRTATRSLKGELLGCWPLLLPLLVFLPGIDGFPYPNPEAPYSDLMISHYPNALYLKRVLSDWGVIPLWSPTILSGYPFAANPLSGLWYPPGWLALLFPLPLGFNLLVMLHLLWGGLGMRFLLKAEGLSEQAALFGSMAFVALPKLYAQYGAGHLTMLYAIPWTPWLLLGRKVFGIRYWVSGFVLALIFLADPRWAPYAGLLWFAYIFAHSQSSGRLLPYPKQSHSNLQYLISNIQYLFSNLIIAALLAAPLALPLLQYTRLSTRSSLTAADVLAHSLPPTRLLGLLFPDFGGNHEWMLYPGGVVLILALVSIILRQAGRRKRFWLVVFLLSLFYSLGSYLPGLEFVAQIPGFDLLRVPPRALFLSGMAAAVMAAYGLEVLISLLEIKNQRMLSLALVALLAFAVSLGVGVKALTGIWVLNFLWGAGVVLLVSLWMLVKSRMRLPTQTWVAVLFIIALVDWGAVNNSVLSFRNKEIVQQQAAEVAAYLKSRGGDFRVYSPSYSLPQQTAVHYGLELADGVDPLQLAAYATYMEGATGVPQNGYSVTMPPFADGDPQTANRHYRPNAQALALLDVGYILAEYDLSVDDLLLEEQIGDTRIYKNGQAGARAWLGDEPIPAEALVWEPNQITVEASGPGLLVLSEIAYPGWSVAVDGMPAELEIVEGILRGVRLTSGEHEVRFVFRPLSVYLGLALCCLGLLLLRVFWRIDHRSEL